MKKSFTRQTIATVDKKSTPKAPARTSAAEQRRLQMADIARLAGVSTATVSRALNNSSLVNDETRTRIVKLARSLNYTVNIGAKNLRLGQNRTIGVVLPFDEATRQHVTDPFFLSIVGSLADALTESGYDMLLSRVSADRLDSAAALYDAGRAVGIILIGQWHHHDQLNELALRRVPLAVWGARLPQQLYCSIGSDNEIGGFLATEHLIATGRKRIAFFGDVQFPEAELRYDGYRRALAINNIAFDPALVHSVSFVADSTERAVAALEENGVEFDAIFACSDLIAMKTVNTLRELGKNVPDDVAVVGYDDIELAANFHPPLTTVRQPMADAGKALVAAVLDQLAGNHPSPAHLKTELIVRKTTDIAKTRKSR
jgi:DNA-binding LacI/PurR family transcriptional regulator